MKFAIQWYLKTFRLVAPIRIQLMEFYYTSLKPGKIEKKNQIKIDFTPKLVLQ